jgi:hypothetical protein
MMGKLDPTSRGYQKLGVLPAVTRSFAGTFLTRFILADNTAVHFLFGDQPGESFSYRSQLPAPCAAVAPDISHFSFVDKSGRLYAGSMGDGPQHPIGDVELLTPKDIAVAAFELPETPKGFYACI